MKRMILSIMAIAGLFLLEGSAMAQTMVWEKSFPDSVVCLDQEDIISINNNIIIKTIDYIVIDTNYTTIDLTSITGIDSAGNLLWNIRDSLPSLSLSAYGNNSFLTKDSLYDIDVIDGYSGKLQKKIFLPELRAAEGVLMHICHDKSNGNYYLVTTELGSSYGYKWEVFVYDQNFSFIRSFSVMDGNYGFITSAFATNGNIYFGRWRYHSLPGHSNIASDVYKYDSMGNQVWVKNLQDRRYPYLALGVDGGLYLGVTSLGSDSANLISWETFKLDTANGNTVWQKNWFGHNENKYDGVQVYGIVALPTGGCVTLGTTNVIGYHYRQNPAALGYAPNGDSLFYIEPLEAFSPHVYGQFNLGAWDKDNNLILAGIFQGDQASYSTLRKYSIPGITAVKKENSGIPTEFSLSQNYPNPFNPSTKIDFSVPQSGSVSLKIYDLLGREVAILVDKELRSGNYSASFNAANLASGVYIYRLTAKNFAATKKMVLLK